jgi:hypothetical protein
VHTFVLLVSNNWEFKEIGLENKFRISTQWRKLLSCIGMLRRKHMMRSILMMRMRKIWIRVDTFKSSQLMMFRINKI